MGWYSLGQGPLQISAVWQAKLSLSGYKGKEIFIFPPAQLSETQLLIFSEEITMVGFFVSDLRHTPVNLEMLTELGTWSLLWYGEGKVKAIVFLPCFQASLSIGLTKAIYSPQASCID